MWDNIRLFREVLFKMFTAHIFNFRGCRRDSNVYVVFCYARNLSYTCELECPPKFEYANSFVFTVY